MIGFAFINAPTRASLVVSAAVLSSVLVLTTTTARADTPEYWTRETFHTERPTMVAALSSDDDDEAPRAKRRSVARSSDDDDTPAPRARRRAAAETAEVERPARQAKAKSRNVRVASLGDSYAPAAKPQRSVSGGGGVRWAADSGCLNGTLRGVIAQVASQFGSVTVNSTCRSRGHNARVGGAPRSMHLSGDAADLRVHGNWGAAASFMRGIVGGFKHYGGGLFHIDTGTRRSW
ncbi:MAG: D-Ala-D-Ala carboxypeptidase family metallohydrolase [Hyphomicrobiaceae bacterium]